MANKLNQIISRLSGWPKEHWLMSGLCCFAFAIVALADRGVFFNSLLIMQFEYYFIALYLLALREFPPFIKIIKENSLVSFVLFIWVLIVTLAFINSTPIQSVQLAQHRYIQTITHVLFFIFIWDFFNRYRPPLTWLFYTIAASSLYIAALFAIEFFSIPDFDGNTWMMDPPGNPNIRHTGYQVEATLVFFLAYFIKKYNLKLPDYINVVFLAILWGFIFWLGGRGSIVSISASAALIWLVLYIKNLNSRVFLLISLCTIFVGIILAESLSITYWNGLSGIYQRSIIEHSLNSLNELNAKRIDLWVTTWDTVKNSPTFGLGPQGYLSMPNRIMGVQPHNIFLQFMIEWGVFGSILFLSLLTRAFWAGVKTHILDNKSDINSFSLAAGAVITTLSIHSLIDGTYYHPQPSVYLAIAFAIWIIPSYKKKTI